MLKWKKNLYAVWFTQFLSLMGFGFGMPFLPFYIQDLGITDPVELKLWTGWLAAAPSVAMAIMAPVWGILADKIGKKPMLIRAMLGGTVVLIGLGLARSAVMVLIFRIIQGLISGTVTSSAALVATGTPDKKLSYALGFISSSTFVGYSLGPAVGGLIAEHFGYRVSFLTGSGFVFIGLLLVLFLIQEPTPEMAGRAVSKDVFEDEIADIHKAAKLSGTKIMTPFIIMLFLLFFFIRLSRITPTPFLPLFIQDLRGTIEGSAKVTGLLSGGIGLMAAVSGLTLSRLGDRMDRLKLLSVLILCGAITSSLISIIPGLAVGIASLLVTYFLIGGVEPLLMSITSEQVSSEKRGMLFGIQTAVGSLAWFFSPLLGSYVSIKFSISAIFILFTGLLVITFVIANIVRIRNR